MKRQKKPEETQQATISKLRAENRKLRKDKRVLQAQLKRYVDLEERIVEEPTLEDFVETYIETHHCPKCGAEVDIIQAGKYKLWNCGECKSKGKIG